VAYLDKGTHIEQAKSRLMSTSFARNKRGAVIASLNADRDRYGGYRLIDDSG
jgi:hypothetical protein